MDKENVIIPTNNLDKLEQDMDQWNLLPYKFKKLSNAACLTKYNCSVYDLYTKLKANILNKEAENEQEPDNLVVINTESAEEQGFYDYSKFGELMKYDNYDELVSISNALCDDPNIVIINPTDIHDFEDKFDRYNHLIQKFKTFSNDYSIQLWGYNVPNMYRKVKADVDSAKEPSNQTPNNVIFNPMEGCYMTLINQITTESANCISNPAYRLFKKTNDPVEESIYNEEVNAQKDLNVSIPKVVPWFTIDEMNQMGIKFTHTDPNSYIKAINEAITEEEKLNLGWNPSLEPNEKSFKVAQNRQKIWFDKNMINVTDIRSYKISEFSKKPIYLAIENPLPDSADIENHIDRFSGNHYTKYMIIIDDVSYITDNNGVFRRTSISNFNNFELIAVFCDDNIYEAIKNNIDEFQSINNDSGSLYKYIFNRQSCMDRTKEKLVYAYIENQLMNIANVDKTDNKFFIKGFYRVFRGNISEFDVDRVKNTIHIIKAS